MAESNINLTITLLISLLARESNLGSIYYKSNNVTSSVHLIERTKIDNVCHLDITNSTIKSVIGELNIWTPRVVLDLDATPFSIDQNLKYMSKNSARLNVFKLIPTGCSPPNPDQFEIPKLFRLYHVCLERNSSTLPDTKLQISNSTIYRTKIKTGDQESDPNLIFFTKKELRSDWLLTYLSDRLCARKCDASQWEYQNQADTLKLKGICPVCKFCKLNYDLMTTNVNSSNNEVENNYSDSIWFSFEFYCCLVIIERVLLAGFVLFHEFTPLVVSFSIITWSGSIFQFLSIFYQLARIQDSSTLESIARFTYFSSIISVLAASFWTDICRARRLIIEYLAQKRGTSAANLRLDSAAKKKKKKEYVLCALIILTTSTILIILTQIFQSQGDPILGHYGVMMAKYTLMSFLAIGFSLALFNCCHRGIMSVGSERNVLKVIGSLSMKAGYSFFNYYMVANLIESMQKPEMGLEQIAFGYLKWNLVLLLFVILHRIFVKCAPSSTNNGSDYELRLLGESE